MRQRALQSIAQPIAALIEDCCQGISPRATTFPSHAPVRRRVQLLPIEESRRARRRRGDSDQRRIVGPTPSPPAERRANRSLRPSRGGRQQPARRSAGSGIARAPSAPVRMDGPAAFSCRRVSAGLARQRASAASTTPSRNHPFVVRSPPRRAPAPCASGRHTLIHYPVRFKPPALPASSAGNARPCTENGGRS